MNIDEHQTFCLRWNNYKSNLFDVLDTLVQMEYYADCTIYVDENAQFKAHRMILSACSSYLQSILEGVTTEHSHIFFPECKPDHMRVLLDYMYTGEVKVEEKHMAGILEAARYLEVKGLVDLPGYTKKQEEGDNVKPAIFTASPDISSTANSNNENTACVPDSNFRLPYSNLYLRSAERDHDHIRDREQERERERENERERERESEQREREREREQLQRERDRDRDQREHLQRERERMIPWSMQSTSLGHSSPGGNHNLSHTTAAAMLSAVYESAGDMNPLKRKKLSSISSMLMSRDTPILRNVLAQSSVADSSQPVSLVCQSIKTERMNGSIDYEKTVKSEEPHSPYTDKSYDEERDRHSLSLSSISSPGYPETKNGKIVPYVAQQKPEWKRYKQYSRNDIMCAIECVKNGMSALSASRKFNVPSRTLYDKVKKLGITTSRPMNRSYKRSNNLSSAAFPYGIGGTSSPYGSQQSEGEELHPMSHPAAPIPHPAAALLDSAFLQQALESRGGDIGGREALHAMAIAAAAHAAVNGMSTSPGNNGNARSPSPSVVKYMAQQRILSPENIEVNRDDTDEVEDLSVARKEVEQPGVIVHPMSLATMLKQEMNHTTRLRDVCDMRDDRETKRREVAMEVNGECN